MELIFIYAVFAKSINIKSEKKKKECFFLAYQILE